MTKPYIVQLRPRWLAAEFGGPWNVLSWAIVNGCFQRTSQVAWLYLRLNEIAGVEDPREWMRAEMYAAGLGGAVGLMTSRREHCYEEAHADGCFALATVGLSNALRAGDPVGTFAGPSTINLLVCSPVPLTQEAALEAMSLASEAKTLAMLESGRASVISGLPASGTGTDCIAIAWPLEGEHQTYAGKHTAVGSAIGRAVYDVVSKGIAVWSAEQ